MAQASYVLKLAYLTPTWDDEIKEELIQDLERWWNQYGLRKYKDRITFMDMI